MHPAIAHSPLPQLQPQLQPHARVGRSAVTGPPLSTLPSHWIGLGGRRCEATCCGLSQRASMSSVARRAMLEGRERQSKGRGWKGRVDMQRRGCGTVPFPAPCGVWRRVRPTFAACTQVLRSYLASSWQASTAGQARWTRVPARWARVWRRGMAAQRGQGPGVCEKRNFSNPKK